MDTRLCERAVKFSVLRWLAAVVDCIEYQHARESAFVALTLKRR